MKFVAFERAKQGTGASRRLRNTGKTPGIVYGGEGQPQLIELDHNALWHALKKEAFHSSILDMELGKNIAKVLLRDVQMHPFKQLVLHVDFQRVDKSKKIHMKVPLHFINADIAPGVKVSSGIVSHIINDLLISCLPKDLPEFIEVDLKDLAAGHSLHLSNLQMPAGVESVALNKGDDQSVATIIIPRAVAAEEDAAAVTAAADVPAANQKAKEEEAPKKDDKAGGKDKK